MNKSPLRYVGGKTRACKKLDEIVNKYFDINEYKNIISPFFGGGSFEFYIQNKYNLNIIANDKFTLLYNFWKHCKETNNKLCYKLYKFLDTIDKDTFIKIRNKINDENSKFKQAYMYFIINRCSFSGSTLSGGFSNEASKKRFTKSSIDNIKKLNLDNFEIYNYDYKEFLNEYYNECDDFIFLDPPYCLGDKASKLYGNKGDMHENFDHEKLYSYISTKSNWIITYNNCDYIKKLYKKYIIIETSWTYGMNKSKKSSEIVIISKLV